MNTISIRQPGYLPFIGFFKKIESVDTFVFLDDVQFTKNDWDNRNKICTSDGEMWLTVPILLKHRTLLNEIKIDNSKNWSRKHQHALEINYQKSPYFTRYWDSINNILEQKWEKLIDLNMEFINYFLSELKINTKTIFSSDLDIHTKGSQKLLDICKKLGSDTYISGPLGKNYLNLELFFNEKIDVVFENFIPPRYSHIYTDFIPNLSIIDLLFNEGENAQTIIKNCKNT